MTSEQIKRVIRALDCCCFYTTYSQQCEKCPYRELDNDCVDRLMLDAKSAIEDLLSTTDGMHFWQEEVNEN